MTIARPMVAFLTIAAATSLGGCLYIPLANEALLRARHVSQRDSSESKAAIQKQLKQFSCFQLSEWEQLVLPNLKAAEDAAALSTLSQPVLRDDLSRIREAMVVRGCPSREQMLAAGTSPPAKGSMLKFACVCWQPFSVTSIAKEGAGPAGPGCVTVRAEVSPGAFAFVENVPTWGERRHEIGRSGSLLFPEPIGASVRIGFPLTGSLNRNDASYLIRGMPLLWPLPDPIATDAESDGWIESDMGRFRFLTDDCKPLSSEQANVVERTVIRWVAEP